MRLGGLRILAALTICLIPCVAQAEWLMLCDRETRLTPTQQDRLYRFAAIVKHTLNARRGPGQDAVLMARSGLNLARFGQRYSHMGIALADSTVDVTAAPLPAPEPTWTVRQLYYACQEKMPRLFDQGVAGFVLGTEQPELGYLSVVMLPAEQAASLAQVTQDKAQALRLLGGRYSANAYPFATRYQNCNQWVVEMLAQAWSPDAWPGQTDTSQPRALAQDWLRAQGFQPTLIEVGPWLMWATPFVPFVQGDDHPPQDLAARRFQVSMPASIEAFVQQQAPDARRIEFCHVGARVVIHTGWDQVAEGCVPGAGDQVIELGD